MTPEDDAALDASSVDATSSDAADALVDQHDELGQPDGNSLDAAPDSAPPADTGPDAEADAEADTPEPVGDGSTGADASSTPSGDATGDEEGCECRVGRARRGGAPAPLLAGLLYVAYPRKSRARR